MASPNLTTECTARLQFPLVQPVRDFNSSFVQFEDGRGQAWKVNDTKRESWDLVFENQTNAEILDLQAFYDARKGSYELFYWNNPLTGENDVPVRFDKDHDPWTANAGIRSVRLRIVRFTV